MSTQNSLEELVKFFFTLQLNIKMYHWNTNSYSRHKATDEFGEKLLGLIDKFVEVYIGRYRIKPTACNIKIDSSYLTDEGSENLLLRARNFLQELDKIVKDTELLNIRDEFLAEINQTLYLFQLK
jgi:hypothetical protein